MPWDGGGGGCRGRRPLSVGMERRLVLFIGDSSKVRRNLILEDALLFLYYAVKLEGAVCTADSFCHYMRFVIISSIHQNYFNNSAPKVPSQHTDTL